MNFFAVVSVVVAVFTVSNGQNSQCLQTPAVQGTRCGGQFGTSGVVQSFTYRNGQCISFVYAGCGGNSNRFSTLAQCQQVCANGGTVGGQTCFSNTQCVNGQICQNNRCTGGTTGTFCTTQAQCVFGQTCQANRCVTGTSTGTFCTTQSQCTFGQTCQFNRCTAGTTSGTFCSTQAQCVFGQTCQNNRCTTGTSTGGFCTSQAQCTFGQICQFNRCTTSTTSNSQCSILPTVDSRCQLTNQRRSTTTGCWSYTVFCP